VTEVIGDKYVCAPPDSTNTLLGLMAESTHGREIRESLRRIIKTVLHTPGLWPRTELAAKLRQQLETLTERIDSMEAHVAVEYAYAFSRLVSHMPDNLSHVYSGDLEGFVNEVSGGNGH